MPENLKPLASPVSRRTLARGAAWSTPVILASVATPSLAASQLAGVLSLSGSPFALLSLEEKTITGTIRTTTGAQPADLTLTATVTGSFAITSAPVVTGPGTFSLKVKAPSGGTSGTLTVLSTNYPQYGQAQAAIESAPEGIIIEPGSDTLYALTPLSKMWKYTRSSDGVRYYDLASGAAVKNPSVATPLCDLRMSFYGGLKNWPIPENLNNADWVAKPSSLNPTPDTWHGNNTIQVFTYFTRFGTPTRGDLLGNQAAQTDAIRTVMGGTILGGVGVAQAVATMPALWIPNKDGNGVEVGPKGFYLSVPKRPAAGTGGNGMYADVVTQVRVSNSDGQRVTIGFQFSYYWSGIPN